MRIRHSFVVMTFIVTIFSCRKYTRYDASTPGQENKVLLKELFFEPDASPYYHFEYNTQGMITKAIYAGPVYNYDVIYSGNRISELKGNSNIGKDRVLYVYDNTGKAAVINIADQAGVISRRSTLSYSGSQLTGIVSEVKQGTDFVTERTMTFTYLPDGNVSQIDDHIFPVGLQPEIIGSTQYSQYDDKINPANLGFLSDLRDHLFLLPGVQLYKNNPGKMVHTGSVEDFSLDITYTYNSNNAPSERRMEGAVTRGVHIGERIDQKAVYTYY